MFVMGGEVNGAPLLKSGVAPFERFMCFVVIHKLCVCVCVRDLLLVI